MATPLPNALIGAVLLVFGGLAQAASIEALSTDSPFLPRGQTKSAGATQAPAAPEEPSTVEFRGLMTTAEGTFFGLYDSTSKESMWVKQGVRTDGNVLVKGYDEANDAITLEYKGKPLNLAMASAVIAVSKPTAKEPRANRSSGQSSGNRRPTAQAGGGSETERLRAIADEVRARRAMRVNPQQSQNQPRTRPAGDQ